MLYGVLSFCTLQNDSCSTMVNTSMATDILQLSGSNFGTTLGSISVQLQNGSRYVRCVKCVVCMYCGLMWSQVCALCDWLAWIMCFGGTQHELVSGVLLDVHHRSLRDECGPFQQVQCDGDSDWPTEQRDVVLVRWPDPIDWCCDRGPIEC